MNIFVDEIMTTSEYDEFKVMRLRFSEKTVSHHLVLFKPHSVRVDEPLKPRERTLFCANIPPWAPADSVRNIFQLNGNIENIYYELQPSAGPPPLPTPHGELFKPEPKSDPYAMESGFKFAYIVFERPQGVKNAMNKMDLSKDYFVNNDASNISVHTGVRRWNKEYNQQWKDEKIVSEQIETYMKEYDKSVAHLKQKNEEFEEPDEDGWITVAKVDKKKPVKSADSKVSEKMKGKKNRRKKKKLELQNFYSHQLKEEKVNKIQLLRKKFEEDKLKIAKMKADRKFRPF